MAGGIGLLLGNRVCARNDNVAASVLGQRSRLTKREVAVDSELEPFPIGARAVDEEERLGAADGDTKAESR